MSQYLKLDPFDHHVMSIWSTEPEPEDGYEFRPHEGYPVSFRSKPHDGMELFWMPGSATPEWIDARTLDEARADKATEMRAACDGAILAGFTSSALGAVYRYPAKMTDQTNLAGSILASILPGNVTDWTTPFWCADATGEWAFRPHTAAQIQQVGRDGKTAILAAMTRNEVLRAQIATAAMEALDTIRWGS